MPSRREGLSYAVLEAMAHGVATVVSDGPGNPEAVGDAGLVFPAGDAHGAGRAPARASRRPGRRAALGQAGRDWPPSFTADKMVEEDRERAYEAVLTAPGRGAGGPPA